MTSYLYELPTTGAVHFQNYLNDQDATYITEVSQATEARGNMRATLKEHKRTDVGERDNLKLVKVIDDYLPLLFGIVDCVKKREIGLKAEPIFSWRTTLSSNVFHSSPRVEIPTLATEVAFTMLTYAFALSNLSRSLVQSLGDYEKERTISDTERKAKDERLGFAVTLLCRASGVFEYVGKDSLGYWERERERVVAAGIPCPYPPDLSREVVTGLSKMALADAQTLAIRKLLSKASFDSTLTPGSLPKSHPSPVLIAKLHLECAALYSAARSLVKTPGDARSKSKFKLPLGKDRSKDEGEDVCPELRHYLSDELAFHNALAHKWLGVDAGENSGTSRCGDAVGYLSWTKKELEEMKGGGLPGVIDSEREKGMRERRRARVAQELESVTVFLQGYKRMNDAVAFQPVPPQSDLQAAIPAGRSAVTVKTYERPSPAFGPESVDYIRKQAEQLELEQSAASGEGGEGAGASFAEAASPRSGNSYAGAGSYF